MTEFLDEATRQLGMAIIGEDYEAVHKIVYEVHLNPFHGYSRVPKLIMNVIVTFGDSLFLNQAQRLFNIASDIEPLVTTTIGLNTEFFIYNELLSGQFYVDLEPVLDFIMTDKYGLYLSHRALAAVMMKHDRLDLDYGLIPSQQDAKEYLIKTLDMDFPSLVVAKAVERFDELSSSMYYDYIYNLRYTLLCTAYDIFKDMPKHIVEYIKTIQVKDDLCIQWIEDLIGILDTAKDGNPPKYVSPEEEIMCNTLKQLPMLVVNVPDQGRVEQHRFSIRPEVAYRLMLIAKHPVFDPWFEAVKLK